MRILILCCVVLVGCSETPTAEPPEKLGPGEQITIQESQFPETAANEPTELQKAATNFADSLDQYRSKIESLLSTRVTKDDRYRAKAEVLGSLETAELSFLRVLELGKHKDEFFGDALESDPDRDSLEMFAIARGDWGNKNFMEMSLKIEALIRKREKKAREEGFLRVIESQDEEIMGRFESQVEELMKDRKSKGEQVDDKLKRIWKRELIEGETRHMRELVQSLEAEVTKQEERIEAALERISTLAKAIRERAQ